MGERMAMNIISQAVQDAYYHPDGKWAYVIALDPSKERANYSELDQRADYFYEAVTTSSGW